MIPEVAAVVRTALAYVDSSLTSDTSEEWAALLEAVEAYRMRESRPAGAVTYEETDRTWGEVVTGDEILSAKTMRWYEVIRTVIDEKAGTIKLNIQGSPKPIIRPLSDPVKVKRGVMGDTADLFTILWSGTHTLGQHADTTGTGPMLGEHETEEDGHEGE